MDIMEIDDDTYINKNLVTQVNFPRRKQHCRCVTVGLGLLCAVLLAANIGQVVFHELLNQPASTDPTQANYNALTQEKDHLQHDSDRLRSSYDELRVVLGNLTQEKHQLQQSYKSLTTERDEFKASFNNVKTQWDQLHASCNTLKQDSKHLQKTYNDMQSSLEGLQTDHHDLTASKAELQTKHSDLQREKDELHALFTALVAKGAQLASNYSSLRRDADQLQRSYNTLNTSRNLIEISYKSLRKDKDRLQTTCDALRREKVQLQASYGSLAAGRDQLRRNRDKLTVKVRGMLCPTRWRKFDISCYFVSTVRRNWTESRRACVAEGADLVVVDGRDEQVFVNGLLDEGQNAWIGLTDSLTEGAWTWIDGTPVNVTYWQPGQPNNFKRNQDCGEFVHKSSGQLGQWNDDGCFAEQIWICEK